MTTYNKIRKENILKYHSPEIIEEFWDYDKNIKNPENVSIYATYKTWWKCKKGHTYDQSPANKVIRGSGCPFCSNQRVCSDNCLESKYPQLKNAWSPNNQIKPSDVLAGSVKKVLWICNLHGDYSMSINKKVLGQDCPKCKSKRMVNTRKSNLNREDSIIGKYGEIVNLDWDYEKNGEEKPEQYTQGSTKNVWWKCSKHGSYKQIIHSHLKGYTGCKTCIKNKIGRANRYVPLKESLAITNTPLLSLWDKAKNDSLFIDPCHISEASGISAYFKCHIHGSYLKEIRKMMFGEYWECPNCSPRGSNSKPNMWIKNYLDKLGIVHETEVRISDKNRWRFDFLIGNTLIEYDGSYYHRTLEQILRDFQKYTLAKDKGYSLCRIREKSCIYLIMADDTYELSSNDYGKKQQESLYKVIDDILETMKYKNYLQIHNKMIE